MSNSLFNPDSSGNRASVPQVGASHNVPATASDKAFHPLTVTQLARSIKDRMESAYPTAVRVLGEVSNFSHRTHWYFAIKDANAVLHCVMFAGRTRACSFVPQNGQSVVVTARVDVYEAQGKLTLMVEKIEPVGLGALDEAYKALVKDLRAAGWFDPERKRVLPLMPRRVAVITSRTGAALHDVLNTMARRCPGVEVALIDCLVQGSSAAPEVAHAVRWVSANAKALRLDALLVTRGGGSIEDLWAFNERVVASAVRDCSVPVVAAIGHETDTTIVELVADARASTPTQAAMLLTPDRAALLQELRQAARRLQLMLRNDLKSRREHAGSLGHRLPSGIAATLQRRSGILDRLAARLERVRPAARQADRQAFVVSARRRLSAAVLEVLRHRARVIEASHGRLRSAQQEYLYAVRRSVDRSDRVLELLSPLAVLRRGYSLTYGPGGNIVRRPIEVQTGDRLMTRLAEGEISSTVGDTRINPLASTDASPSRSGVLRRRKRPTDDGAGGLFG